MSVGSTLPLRPLAHALPSFLSSSSSVLGKYQRSSFPSWSREVPVHSWHLFGTSDRTGFLHSVIREVLVEEGVSQAADPSRAVFMSDSLYHLHKLRIPGTVDFGVAVAELKSHSVRLHAGLFDLSISAHSGSLFHNTPSVLLAVDLSFLSAKEGRVTPVPERYEEALLRLMLRAPEREGEGEEEERIGPAAQFGL